MNKPLMAKATAVWLVDNTTLSFRQIAEFCGLHELEVAAIEQRSANRVLVESLTQLSASQPTLAVVLEAKMAEAGIQPPTENTDLDDDGGEEA